MYFNTEARPIIFIIIVDYAFLYFVCEISTFPQKEHLNIEPRDKYNILKYTGIQAYPCYEHKIKHYIFKIFQCHKTICKYNQIGEMVIMNNSRHPCTYLKIENHHYTYIHILDKQYYPDTKDVYLAPSSVPNDSQVFSQKFRTSQSQCDINGGGGGWNAIR